MADATRSVSPAGQAGRTSRIANPGPESARHTPRVDRRTAIAANLVLAAVLGVTVGLMLPEAIQWAIIAAGTIAALFIRYGVLHDPVWSRVDLAWLAVFAATWLPVAALLGHWPFR